MLPILRSDTERRHNSDSAFYDEPLNNINIDDFVKTDKNLVGVAEAQDVDPDAGLMGRAWLI